jgi:hypothetical protein
MADKRSETSADNGKKGGRPVSEATIRAQIARQYIAEQVKKSLEPIVAKAINDAILGSSEARHWLSDQAWGKPTQMVEHSGELALIDDEARDKAVRAIQELLNAGDTE